MCHGDEAGQLPPGFHRTAVTSNALAGIANEERRIWAVQFHPEVHHTPLGPQLIKNFVFNICGAAGDWTPAHFIETTVAAIRQKVGSGHVICGLSGGVDSSVAAVLVHKAIGAQLTCIFVNNGVLRKNEFQSVQNNLRDKLGLNIVAVDASQRFLTNSPASPIPKPNANSSAQNSSPSLTTKPPASRNKPAVSIGWSRELSTPTSSSPAASKAPARPSRATTTSAACRST